MGNANIVISNNHFYGPHSHQVEIDGVDGGVISGNSFNNSYPISSNVESEVYLDRCNNIKFSNNKISYDGDFKTVPIVRVSPDTNGVVDAIDGFSITP